LFRFRIGIEVSPTGKQASHHSWKEGKMPNRDVVVVGASAGGVEALQRLVRGLPADFGAAVLIVLHVSGHTRSYLPSILDRATALPVIHAEDGMALLPSRICIAPPNFHMIVADGFLRIVHGPKENLHRPAIDPLFRSAAAAYGARVIGVILSGALDDGTSGLMMVRASGGTAIIQDPATATHSSMPASALEQVPDAYVLPVDEIADLLVHLTQEELPAAAVAKKAPKAAGMESRLAEFDMAEIENESRRGDPSGLGCPDCGGVLWEINENGFLRYRCRVGHAFTAKYLEAEQRHSIESALWAALRALEESASLSSRMAYRADNLKQSALNALYQERAAAKQANARILREFLLEVNSRDEEQQGVLDETPELFEGARQIAEQ
jgi:two-component system chemotaxis response regulator CheB